MQQTSKQLILFWIDKINDFLRERGEQIDPLPKIEIYADDLQQNSKSDILISTGGYQPLIQTIILFIDNRHIKDILRSYCHEMIHHMQWLENPDYIKRIFALPQDSIDDNKELEDIEGEAYLKGNLLFRKFTEAFKKSQTNLK